MLSKMRNEQRNNNLEEFYKILDNNIDNEVGSNESKLRHPQFMLTMLRCRDFQ